jgi:hypothetical protein
MAQRIAPIRLESSGALVGLVDIDDAAEAATDVDIEFFCTGRETLYVSNGSGSPITATPTGYVDRSGMFHDVAGEAITVPAGEIGVIGPLNPAGFSSAGLATVVLSVFADVKVLLVSDRR